MTEPFNLHVEVDGFAVFLDNSAIKELSSKFHAARRKRFIAALDRGARVLFSVGNAAKLSGDSFLDMRAGLRSAGEFEGTTQSLTPYLITGAILCPHNLDSSFTVSWLVREERNL